MNRYVSNGLAQDATDGKRAIFCGMASEARAIFHQVAAIAEGVRGEADPITGVVLRGRVSRVNGAESVVFPSGGSVRFVYRLDQLKNTAADVVYLSQPEQEWVMEALVAVSTRSGEVIRP